MFLNGGGQNDDTAFADQLGEFAAAMMKFGGTH
jgi:hypothetical protein